MRIGPRFIRVLENGPDFFAIYCHHRVVKGLIPACADNVCPDRCIRFGDTQAVVPMPMGLRG